MQLDVGRLLYPAPVRRVEHVRRLPSTASKRESS